MPYRNLRDSGFQGDFWDMLSVLTQKGSTMYPWQKELLMTYLLKSPSPHLQLQSFTAPEEYGRGAKDWGFWQKGKGFDVLAALLEKKTDPAETPMPPEIMPLYKMGFGKMRKDIKGRNISFKGFKPEDMLAVLFSKTQPQEMDAKVPAFLEREGLGTRGSGSSFEQLASRLSHEQLWDPLYGGGKWGGGVSEAWRPRLSDEDKSFYLKQLGYGQGLLGKMRGEQEAGNIRYARSEAQRKAESTNLLQGLMGMGAKILPKLATGGLVPSFESFASSFLAKNPFATEEEIREAWMNLQTGQSMFSGAVGSFW